MKKNKKIAVRFTHTTFFDDEVLEKIGMADVDVYKHAVTNSYDIKFDDLLKFEEFADKVEKVTGERPVWTQCYSVEVAA